MTKDRLREIWELPRTALETELLETIDELLTIVQDVYQLRKDKNHDTQVIHTLQSRLAKAEAIAGNVPETNR
jgi:hypothetical protein